MNARTVLVCLTLSWLAAAAPGAAADVAALQHDWAEIMYRGEPDAREAALERLAEASRAELARDPANPALLIWHGIVVSSYAGEKGGLGALGLVKEARASLERAIELDPRALRGSAYTSLGSLYYKVPGWPIGFGSSRKARQHLEQALEINPMGIDPNFFMAEFLFEQGAYAQAREHLMTALQAPDRPGRATADQGRRQEARDLLARVTQHEH